MKIWPTYRSSLRKGIPSPLVGGAFATVMLAATIASAGQVPVGTPTTTTATVPTTGSPTTGSPTAGSTATSSSSTTSTGTTTGGTTGTTGGGPGSWKIEYKLDGYRQMGTTSVNWGPPSGSPGEWFTSASGASEPATIGTWVSGGGTVASSGTIHVRFTWQGTGAAPTDTWVMVDSSASWARTHGSGDAINAFEDTPVDYTESPYMGNPVTGKKATGKRIFRLTSGSVTKAYSMSASCSAGPMANGMLRVSVGLVATIVDRKATLSRSDGGIVRTLGDGSYEGDTLLSWSGSGMNPGVNTQSLQGVYSGTWSTKANPGGNPATVDDTIVKWSGSSQGDKTHQPPTPATSVRTTTYSGTMPAADASLSTKTETWKYKVKDNVDGAQIDLSWKWIAHYVQENWQELASQTAYRQVGADLAVANLTVNNPTAQTVNIPLYRQTSVTSEYTYGAPSPAINVDHIGIAQIRDALLAPAVPLVWGYPGEVGTIDFQYIPYDYEGGYGGPGTYVAKYFYTIKKKTGTIDVYAKTGFAGVAPAVFYPSSTVVKGAKVFAPGEWQ